MFQKYCGGFHYSILEVGSHNIMSDIYMLLSLRLEGVEALKYHCVCWPPSVKVYDSK